MDKDIKSIINKYKKESKKDGFKTRTSKDLQKDRDKIKSGYVKKLIFSFVATLLLVASWKFFTGDYTPIQRATDQEILIADNIEAGSGEPFVEILKDNIENLKNEIQALKNEYNEKLHAQEKEYQTKLDEVKEKARKAIEEQDSKNQALISKKDDNSTDEKIIAVRNSLLSEIEQLRESLKSIIAEKKETLPVYEKQYANAVDAVNNDILKSEVLTDMDTKGTKEGDSSEPKYVFEQYDIRKLKAEVDEQIVLNDNKNNENNETLKYEITVGLSQALLITGVQAPTFGEGRENPKPVMVSFTSPVLLANDYKANITDCVGVGAAVGNMNTKRAEITITRLSCVMEQNGEKYKVSAPVKGFVIGRDGAYGVPGRLVDSGAKVVMRQLQVGFLQGVASAFQYSQAGLQGAYLTNGTIGELPKPKNMALSGASNAASTGLNSLASYYTSMMEGLYPTISVRAGVSIDVFWPKDHTITLQKVKLYDVDDQGDYQDSIDFPFQTESDEELVYDSW